MDIRKVKKLIELLEESGVAEIEIKEGEESPKQRYRISLARVHKKPDSYLLVKSETFK